VIAERSLFVFQAEDGIRDRNVTGVQTCALPICRAGHGTLSEHIISNPLLTVQRLLGHASPATTMIYLRYLEEADALIQRSFDARSEERRVGKECRSRRSTDHQTTSQKTREGASE